jgi:hypothetical protein
VVRKMAARSLGMTLGFGNSDTEKAWLVGAFAPCNGFDGPVNLPIVHPLSQGGGSMNRLAGLNLRYQSLRSTIRQEQIQLTHLRKQDSKFFIRCCARTKGAKNAACNFIKPGWPIVPIAKSLSLGGRKLYFRRCSGVTSSPKLQLQLGVSLSRVGSSFLAMQANSGSLLRPIAINQAIHAISGSTVFKNT